MSFLKRSSFAIVLSFAIATAAAAKEAVVSPFIPRSVDKLVALNITSLVSSELDFMPDYELVTQLESLPRGMTGSCINKSSCLRPISRAHNANHLIAGTVAPSGSKNFQLYLVLFDADAGSFIRKKTFTISRSPDVMADSIANIVNVLLTGKEKTAPVDESAPIADGSFDDFGDEEDFSFDEEPTSHRMKLPGSSNNTLDDFEDIDPLEEESSRAEEERKRRDEERRAKEERERREKERRAKEERERREKERRAKEERERKRLEKERRAEKERERKRLEKERRASEDRKRREKERREKERRDQEEDELDIDDFEFGDVSTADIEEEDFEFGDISADEIEEDLDDDLDDLGLNDSYGDPEFFDEPSYDSVDSLDDPVEPTKARNTPKKKKKNRAAKSSNSPKIQAPYVKQSNSLGITAKAGMSKFQSLNFLTYGAEIAIPAGERASFTVGLELQSTKRTPTREQQVKLNLPAELWNTIMPINFGGIYRFGQSRFQPFVGADLVLTPYTKDFKIAVGARARAGADIMLTKKMGINAGLSTGAWYGSRFDNIDEGLSDFGIVPQVTLGTSVLF